MKEKWFISQANSKDANVSKQGIHYSTLKVMSIIGERPEGRVNQQASDLVWKHKKAVDMQGQERR